MTISSPLSRHFSQVLTPASVNRTDARSTIEKQSSWGMENPGTSARAFASTFTSAVIESNHRALRDPHSPLKNPDTQGTMANNANTASLSEKNTDFAPTAATGRPQGDHRTAEQIISENPILNNLPSSVSKEAMFKHLGDWTSSNPDPEKRADAAFNAARLFNYIDGLEAKQSARGDSKQGDGKIKGEYWSPLPPPFDEVSIEENSEAALVKKFSEEGYAALGNQSAPLASENEKAAETIPTSASGRPEGDGRTADQILSTNPIVARLESSLAKQPGGAKTLENLKALTGDWSENNTNADSRADAAYNIAKVANYFDANPTYNRFDEAFDNIGPGHLTGFTRNGANPGTEASALIDFSNIGYTALAG